MSEVVWVMRLHSRYSQREATSSHETNCSPGLQITHFGNELYLFKYIEVKQTDPHAIYGDAAYDDLATNATSTRGT